MKSTSWYCLHIVHAHDDNTQVICRAEPRSGEEGGYVLLALGLVKLFSKFYKFPEF